MNLSARYMYLFFETIKIYNGSVQNLFYHQKRMDNTLKLNFIDHSIPPLENIIDFPPELNNDTLKCRIDYSNTDYSMTFEKYVPKKIETLKVVADDSITYNFKYSDREKLNKLLEKKGKCDEIIIVRNGLFTDTTFTNIIFSDGQNWYTPATPLLKGTCRARLLNEGRVFEKKITIDDLENFHYFKLINSMLNDDFTDYRPVSSIVI